eukprot:gb/GEZN01002856.1/.p1 GENE.gb/GEZN01002856.1/~~gb/GEZN01002856.1/.p1  ORF type:complete len:641 (-),score=123.07 gb/GEZN01002856.1/:240-2162(-)
MSVPLPAEVKAAVSAVKQSPSRKGIEDLQAVFEQLTWAKQNALSYHPELLGALSDALGAPADDVQVAACVMINYLSWHRVGKDPQAVLFFAASSAFRAALTQTLRGGSITAKCAAVSVIDCFTNMSEVTAIEILESWGILDDILALAQTKEGRNSIMATGALHGFSRYPRSGALLVENSAVLPLLEQLIQAPGQEESTAATAAQCALAFAYLVGKEEVSFLSDHPHVLRTLVQILHLSLQGKNYAGMYWGAFGLLRALASVVVSGSNKPHLEQLGFNELVLHMLCVLVPPPADKSEKPSSAHGLASALAAELKLTGLDLESHALKFPRRPGYSKNEETLELCANALLEMTFLESSLHQLRALPVLPLLVIILAGDSGAECSKAGTMAVERLIWTLRDRKEEKKETPNQSARKGHVMISYCWAEQPLVKLIVGELKRRDVEVWFDLDRMQGSTVGAMAEAVENASIVLVCISNNYKKSANCRLEAEYSLQRKTPFIPLMLQKNYQPDGWLGLMMGTRLWYPFLDPKRTPITQGLDQLWPELQRYTTATSSSAVATAPYTTSAGPAFTTWTSAQVGEWLVAVELGQYVKEAASVSLTGQGLQELRTLQAEHGFHLLQLLKTELHVTFFGDALRLAHELRQLQ